MSNKKGNNWIEQLTVHFEMIKTKDINYLKQEQAVCNVRSPDNFPSDIQLFVKFLDY